MQISNLVNENLINLNLNVGSREAALDEMIEMIDRNGNLSDPLLFKNDVYYRESEGPTGVGMELAIPHGKSDGVRKECFCIARSETPIAWNSLDSQGVRLIIMLAVPDVKETNLHIKMLSRLSYFLMDDAFRNGLMAAESTHEIIQLINQKEEE